MEQDFWSLIIEIIDASSLKTQGCWKEAYIKSIVYVIN